MLAVIYLIFNEGYTASAGDQLVRADLCAEAIRLGRLLVELMPDEAEALGLLALMLLIEARRAARTTADGDLVLLADQDRELWDRDLIAEGPGPRPALPAAQPARPVPDPGGNQRRPQRRVHRGGDRLAADPAAVRPAPGGRPEPGRSSQPRGRRGRGRGTARGTRPRRRALRSSTTTCSTPSAPTCSAASDAPPRRYWRMRRHSPAPRTRSNGPSCSVDVRSSLEREAGHPASDVNSLLVAAWDGYTARHLRDHSASLSPRLSRLTGGSRALAYGRCGSMRGYFSPTRFAALLGKTTVLSISRTISGQREIVKFVLASMMVHAAASSHL